MTNAQRIEALQRLDQRLDKLGNELENAPKVSIDRLPVIETELLAVSWTIRALYGGLPTNETDEVDDALTGAQHVVPTDLGDSDMQMPFPG